MPSKVFPRVQRAASVFLMLAIALGPSITPVVAAANDRRDHDSETATAIKHVIVIVGENRSFDHLFATYVPKSGESVNNLLSEGIIDSNGKPGPDFSKAVQNTTDITNATTYQLSPGTPKTAYAHLPAPLNGGPTNVCTDNGICTLSDATSSEDGLPALPAPFYQSLLEGGTDLSGKVPDTRIAGASGTAPYSTLMPGPFQLTDKTFPYISYAASPVHRFYQMWQQEDCSMGHVTTANPSGCAADLFTWTEVTVGSNVNGNAQPKKFCTDYAPGCRTTGEGATSMGFYNMLQGDAAYTKFLADHSPPATTTISRRWAELVSTKSCCSSPTQSGSKTRTATRFHRIPMTRTVG